MSLSDEEIKQAVISRGIREIPYKNCQNCGMGYRFRVESGYLFLNHSCKCTGYYAEESVCWRVLSMHINDELNRLDDERRFLLRGVGLQ